MSDATEAGHPGTRNVPRTDWAGLSMEQLAATLADHRIEMSDEHVQGWSMAYDLVDYHGDRLRTYRSLLSQRWPAESSPAAAAFLGVLDSLIRSVDDLREAAPANNGVLVHVVSTLSESRTRLEPLVQSWRGYEKSAQKARASGGKGVDYYRNEQAKLHNEAVRLMFGTGNQVTDANQSFIIPASYQPEPPSDVGEPRGGPSGHSPHANAEMARHSIPGPRPMSPSTTSVSTDTPILAGGPPSTPGTSTSISAPPPVSGDSTGPGSGRLPAGGLWPTRSLSPSADAPTWPPRRSTRSSSGDAVGVSDQEAAGTGQRGRVNGSAIADESAHHGLGATPLGGSALGRSQSRRGRRTGDPYFEWQVARGVPAVLRPPAEPTEHDPGPIFGASR